MRKSLLAAIVLAVVMIVVTTPSAWAVDDSRHAMSQGLRALKLKSYQAAIVHLSAAIEAADLEPRVLSDAHYFRGRALIRIRRQELALNDLSQAILYWPENTKALRVRCRALTLDAKLDAADADCTEAIRLAPKDWRSWFTRGLLRREQNEREGAIVDFSAAQMRMPDGVANFPMITRQLKDFGLLDGTSDDTAPDANPTSIDEIRSGD